VVDLTAVLAQGSGASAEFQHFGVRSSHAVTVRVTGNRCWWWERWILLRGWTRCLDNNDFDDGDRLLSPEVVSLVLMLVCGDSVPNFWVIAFSVSLNTGNRDSDTLK
jgi:hypothetical protein